MLLPRRATLILVLKHSSGKYRWQGLQYGSNPAYGSEIGRSPAISEQMQPQVHRLSFDAVNLVVVFASMLTATVLYYWRIRIDA